MRGWLDLVDAPQVWCFGSLRFWLEHGAEFAGWTYAQDVVWEKHNGSGLQADRFRRVHEFVVHWYRGRWEELRHETPTTSDATARAVRRKALPPQHQGARGPSHYLSEDGGPRLMRSVQYVRSSHGSAINPTQKPLGIIRPLIEYSVAPGGLVLDPFAGSCSTLLAARETGRRAIGIELRRDQCDSAIERLAQTSLVL